MSEQNGQNGAKPHEIPEGITKITVGGYKSIAQEQSIEIRPLTILAGANSSGKSSIMQPLLLMKQTLEVPFDPGAFWLDGPNVKFTSSTQILSSIAGVDAVDIAIWIGEEGIGFVFRKHPAGFVVESLTRLTKLSHSPALRFEPEMTHEQIMSMMAPDSEAGADIAKICDHFGLRLYMTQERCFLRIAAHNKTGVDVAIPELFFTIAATESVLRESIHIPGLRGNPERSYPVTAVNERFPGTFENYTASIVAQWQSDKQFNKLSALRQALIILGLTNAVSAEPINDTQVEIRVGRTLQSGSEDMVSIADVGIGVSQTLPVLVALLAAKPGQLVYLEQPEIHLHPRAQTAMAQVLADAAMRGVRVVAETHSSLLLLGIQTLVAEGKLPPELVKLHWFERGDDGATTIRSADLDEGGAFGDWPEDFGDVSLNAQDRFLDAAEKHLIGK